MRTNNITLSILLAWCSVVAGCPSSDDILLQPDALFRQDIIVDIGQQIEPDTNVQLDSGQTDIENDTGNQGGCSVVEDCALLAVSPCEIPACVDGTCLAEPKPSDSPCDDGNPCTETSCTGGVCVETNAVVCPDDGNVCTAEICNPESGCQSIPTNLECDDGDPCTEGDTCFNSVCQGGTLVCDVGSQDNPAASCAAVKAAEPSAPSGTYWVTLNNGVVAEVFCEMILDGGGWVRIGIVAADIAICNYTQGFGVLTQVIGNPTETTVYPASTVALLAENNGDLMVTTDKGRVAFRSTNPGWNWASIANGTINSVTVADYGVELSINGGPFEALQSPGSTQNGPAMLGGLTGTGSIGLFLGVGSQQTGGFVQDDACLFYQSFRGLYSGQILTPPSVWNVPGQLFLR